VFGERMADELARHGAEVVRVEAEWGRAIETERLLGALDGRTAALFVVHAETSTGVRQPLDGLGDACRDAGALLLVDCVTSLGGVELEVDAWGIDAAFSGTQKCLNCPPGLAPFTAGERALRKLQARERPGPSWYFDLSLVLGYWNADGGRVYHHTAPINLIYGLREALTLVHEEGLEQRWARHTEAHEALLRELNDLGFERLPPPDEALASLLCVRVSEGIDEAAVRGNLLREHGVEVSGGLGALAGKVWRIGVMGEGAKPESRERLVTAIRAELA
jgi:alanine-glyoxylate transaminase/serine-glyoxylate transaminase/serine-pyruvate transaminase